MKLSKESRMISVLFVLGLALRFYHLGLLSLLDNERVTAARVNHSLVDTIRIIRDTPYPPLHFIILNVCTHVFGNSGWVLRFPSAIFSALTIIVIYLLGKELFTEGVGLVSAALLTFSPFALNYAQNAKMYPLFWLLAAASYLFLFRFIKDRKESSYGFYILASILCCYTMYTTFLLLLSQNVIYLFMGERASRGKWFRGQCLIWSCCIPWIMYFLFSRHDFWTAAEIYVPDYFRLLSNSFLLIIGSCRDGLINNSREFLGRMNTFLYVFLAFFFITDTILHRNKKTSLPADFLLLWITIPLGIYLIFDFFFVHCLFSYRYMGFLQVPFFILVSRQIHKLPHLLKKMAVTVLVGISFYSTGLFFIDKLAYPEDDWEHDWRMTADALDQNVGKKDIVIFLDNDPMFRYYYKGDTGKFIFPYEILLRPYSHQKDITSDFLIKQGMLTRQMRSVFFVFRTTWIPEIKLDRFTQVEKFQYGVVGFLKFQRDQ